MGSNQRNDNIPPHNHGTDDLPMTAIANALGNLPNYIFGFDRDKYLRFGNKDVPFFIGDLTVSGGLLASQTLPADTSGRSITLITGGTTSVTGARTTGPLNLETGASLANGNATGVSGNVTIRTGASTDAASGTVQITTGNGGNSSGDIITTTSSTVGVGTQGDLRVQTRLLRPPPVVTTGDLVMSWGCVAGTYVKDVTAAAGTSTFSQGRAIQVIDAYVIKSAVAGGAGDLLTLKNAAGTTIAVFDLNVAAGAVVRATTFLTANATLAASANLQYTTVNSTNCACQLVLTVVYTSAA